MPGIYEDELSPVSGLSNICSRNTISVCRNGASCRGKAQLTDDSVAMRRDEIETAGAGIIRRSPKGEDAFACGVSEISLAMDAADRVRAHPCRSPSKACPTCLRCAGDGCGKPSARSASVLEVVASGRDLPKRDVFRYPAGHGTVACCVSFRVRVSGST